MGNFQALVQACGKYNTSLPERGAFIQKKNFKGCGRDHALGRAYDLQAPQEWGKKKSFAFIERNEQK